MSHPRSESASTYAPDVATSQVAPSIPSRLPQEFLDDGPLREISMEVWASIFKRMDVEGVHTEDAVIRFLTAQGLASRWLDMLQAIHDLGSEVGVESLFEAAAQLGLSVGDWPQHAREIAAEAWARSQVGAQHAAYSRLLLLATIALHERLPNGVDRYYVAKNAVPSKVPRRKVARVLEDHLRPWFEHKAKLGDYVEVKVRPEEDDFSLCIQHGGRAVARRVVHARSQETLRFQPAVTDVIRYESFSGRLRVIASTERLSERYRRAIGLALFEDEAFFTGANLCDLAPLLELLSEGRPLPTPGLRRGILSVRLLNCLWVQEHGLAMRIFGEHTSDCIGRIRRSGLNLVEGRLADARLEFVFRGRQGNERVNASIRVPGHVRIRNRSRREAIEGYLADVGILVSGKGGPRTERVDLWTLGDAAHPLPCWRPVCGDNVLEAINQGLLDERPLQSVGHGSGMAPVVPIESDDRVEHVFVPDEGPAKTVDAKDLVGYRLSESTLARTLAEELGCQRSPRPTSIPGCVDLGPLEVGRERVRPFLLTRSPVCPDGTLLTTLQEIAKPASVVAIIPPSRSVEPALRTVFLQSILPPHSHLRSAIVDELGIANQVSVLDRAPGSARVVIDRTARQVWLERVEITPLSDQLWKLLTLLADAQEQGRTLSSDEVNRTLSGVADGTVLRRTSDAKRYLIERVEKVFAEQQRPVPQDLKAMITMAGSSCRLAFPSYIR